ncbi:MAG: ATP-binding protein [Pseudomonadota bacterium]|nr:ATP-binding protein [Pseudomonadota bacterium]
MLTRKEGSRQRLLIMTGGALVLPAIILLAWSLTVGLLRAQSRVEDEAQTTAAEIVIGADNRLAVYEGVLGTYSTARSLENRDWDTSRERAQEVVELNTGLTALLVIENATGRVMMGSGHYDARSRPELISTDQRPAVIRAGEGCPCVVVRHPIRRLPGYSVVGLVKPQIFQAILMDSHKSGSVAALVDADGDFIGRSLDFQNRVGTPATTYVRQALAKGGRGLYRGRTYEGLENYSAYVMSPANGWSAHVAVDRRLIDSPRLWLFVALVGGALLALLTAGGIVAYAIRDLAARRRTDEQMLRLQKSEAIGGFANTLAHDFNNLLTVIIANLHRIQKANAGPDVSRRAVMALEAANRGAKLTNQLLSFARDGGGRLAVIDVASLLNGVSELLRQSVGQGITLAITPPNSQVSILANRDQMEMALLNLAINARDAMDGSGGLDIAAQRVGDAVEISVKDNGPGIPPTVRDRLFEPFVTTKPAGHGTGLGLAQVAEAIAQAGGAVRLEAPPQGGACFVLSLPVTANEPKP